MGNGRSLLSKVFCLISQILFRQLPVQLTCTHGDIAQLPPHAWVNSVAPDSGRTIGVTTVVLWETGKFVIMRSCFCPLLAGYTGFRHTNLSLVIWSLITFVLTICINKHVELESANLGDLLVIKWGANNNLLMLAHLQFRSWLRI